MEWLNKDIGNKFVIYKNSGEFKNLEEFTSSDFYYLANDAVESTPQETTVTPRKVGKYYVVHITAPRWEDIQEMNNHMFSHHKDKLKKIQPQLLHTPWDKHGGGKYEWISILSTLELGHETQLNQYNYELLLISHGDYPSRESIANSDWIGSIDFQGLDYSVILSGHHYALQLFGDKEIINKVIPTISGIERIPEHITGAEQHHYLKTLPPRD